MGRKRKAVANGSAIVDKVKSSKSYVETTTSPGKKSSSDTENSTAAVEGTNVDKNNHSNSNPVQAKEKTPTVKDAVVRRSGRIRSPVNYSKKQGSKTYADHVTLDEDEKEEAPKVKNKGLPVLNEKVSGVEKQVHVTEVSPHRGVDERSLEEKVNYLVRTVDDFKPKVIGQSNEASPSDLRYKSLYFQSEKKNEELMEENYELVRKLEFAHGQISALEKMMDAMGALKEVILMSGLPTHRVVRNGRPSSPEDADADNPKQSKKSHKKRKARN